MYCVNKICFRGNDRLRTNKVDTRKDADGSDTERVAGDTYSPQRRRNHSIAIVPGNKRSQDLFLLR